MFKSAWLWSGISAFGLVAGSAMAQDAKPMPAAPAPAPTTASPVVIGGCSSCCASPCTTSCFDNCGCESSCGQGHMLADVTFMILAPYWKSDPAMFIEKGGGGGRGGDPTFDDKDFGQPSQFVPEIQLGYVGANGFGARIGWWGFAVSKTESQSGVDANGNELFITSATPLGNSIANGNFNFDGGGGNFVASERLRMDVWDFEALQTWESGNASLLVSGGIRYAHIGMDYNAAGFSGAEGFDTPGQIHNLLTSGNNFNGAGFTGAVEARKGRTIYGTASVRGSLLYGTGSQHSTWTEFTPAGGPASFTVADVQSNYHEVLPILEGRLGIGIKGDESRRIVPFFELGFDAQAWFDLGNPSRSTVGYTGNAAPSGFGGGPNFTGSTGDPSLGLFGFYISGGLTY